jgi:hypothetical protein
MRKRIGWAEELLFATLHKVLMAEYGMRFRQEHGSVGFYELSTTYNPHFFHNDFDWSVLLGAALIVEAPILRLHLEVVFQASVEVRASS